MYIRYEIKQAVNGYVVTYYPKDGAKFTYVFEDYLDLASFIREREKNNE
jgi:hypothetical protein